MKFIGENGFRRANANAYIKYVECVNGFNSESEINQCLIRNVYDPLAKNPTDMNRGKAVFQRMGLIKNKQVTNLGQELINDEEWNFNAMTRIEFTFLKSLIYISDFNDNEDFSILKSILQVLVDAYDQDEKITLNESLIKAQPQNLLKKQYPSLLDANNFANAYCNNLNKVGRYELNYLQCKSYWSNYISIIQKIVNEGLTRENKSILIENIKNFRFKIKTKKLSHYEFLLIENNSRKIYKNTYLNNWVDSLKKEDFINLYNQYKLNDIINDHHQFYSLNDNTDITWRNLRLLPFFDFEGKDKVTIKKIYYNLIKRILLKWEQVKARISFNNKFTFDEFLNILKINDFYPNNKSIEMIINDNLSIFKIENILKLFADYENSKALIKKELKLLNYNTDIESFVYFEYFVGLKIIHMSDFQLDESIFNLKLDSFLKPQSHAPGGKADIEGVFNNEKFMIEVSLLKDRAQNKGEAEPIRNHFAKIKPDFACFIAPKISKNLINDLQNGYYDENDFYINTKIIKCLTIKKFLKIDNFKAFLIT